MPRYFLNVRDGGVLVADPEGEEVLDLAQMRDIAEDTVRDILEQPDTYGEARCWDHRSFEITDERGTVLLTLPVSRAAESGGAAARPR